LDIFADFAAFACPWGRTAAVATARALCAIAASEDDAAIALRFRFAFGFGFVVVAFARPRRRAAFVVGSFVAAFAFVFVFVRIGVVAGTEFFPATVDGFGEVGVLHAFAVISNDEVTKLLAIVVVEGSLGVGFALRPNCGHGG
jgi:hypothetical protein